MEHTKPVIREKYCCQNITKIMATLVDKYNITQEQVRVFEFFFNQHSYTNLDMGNTYRDKVTGDLDVDRLLAKIFQVADLFDGEVKEYFFSCFLEDAKDQNIGRIGEPDFQILKNKIEEKRRKKGHPPNISPEIIELQNELGPMSIGETTPDFIIQETKMVFEGMMNQITPEVWQIIEENHIKGIPDTEGLPEKDKINLQSAMKVAQDRLERIRKKARLMALYDEAILKATAPMMAYWQDFKNLQIKGYEKQERSLRHYLAGKNWIVPADGQEFLEWFLGVKHRSSFMENLIKRNVTASPSDFKEFHEWKEPQVWAGKSAQISANNKEAISFDQLFLSVAKMEEALTIVLKLRLVNDGYKWTFRTKEKPMAALWFIWKEQGFVNNSITSDGPAVQIIAARFGKKINKNAGAKFTSQELRAEIKRIGMDHEFD
jgi:hypothetical protein